MKDYIFLYIHFSKQNSVQFTSELLYMMYKTSEVTTYKLVSSCFIQGLLMYFLPDDDPTGIGT